MSIQLCILGSNAALPAHGRNMSAQLLCIRENYFLIDCAEGTQQQFQRFNFKSQKINHIFISHLHGDHIFGLPGLLLSMSMNNRKEKLFIYSPPGLKKFLDTSFNISQSHLSFEIIFFESNPEIEEKLFENNDLCVHSIPLLHPVPTHGFLFREKELPRKMLKEKIVEYSIPYTDIEAIKNGKDWTDSRGKTIPNTELTEHPLAPKSYAYCSDTAYFEDIIPIVSEVDLLYHEATFSNELYELAKQSGHSTATQAAEIAKAAKVKKLLLGHFSSRYKNPQILLDEAKSIFPNTLLANDGEVYSIE
jgi:ribonuclease Z